MAATWTLLSPSVMLLLPTSLATVMKESHFKFRKNYSIRRRLRRVIVSASSDKDDDKLPFNPFGFVTDNASSREAIQLPASPAEDGNVGQMLYVSDSNIPIVFNYEYFEP
ncbi:hypothetical protein GIB67_020677 [Kingdonia uniflora]|uniref:Uncharacterized protein n=1 Tax=Kingdonia uniflora TaxID=39325 RepID=A0A7J7NJE4_9MAGN|nr:hypothetical protein GIB67_020677 [Kingdonia uniflora]